jgi:Golgi phosphoprotein 3
MTTHPLVNCPIKSKLVRRIQDAVLSDWVSDPHLMDKRLLALIILAYHSDVLENAFGPLSDDDYEKAMSNTRTLLELDMEYESSKPNANEALWAVFAAISK